ncbi:expressed unknown protein [Seminavis robusta]|uniref:Uncharacterized protein n=1 Tax=Seminavis robusta TaxID=568900 RepID=A0A9N8DDC7_9STRA|nr:expressed unknown protein [Seminavis robusta]|eukprot:Sro71_g039550.1 n/a (227) ;mRNA; f:111172-111852
MSTEIQEAKEATALDVDPPSVEAPAPVAVPPEPAATAPADPTSLNGCWILDKSKGEWSMRGYLEAMGVNEFCIQMHERGEQKFDIFHTIQFTTNSNNKRVKIIKRGRADVVVNLPLGEEVEDYLPPDFRLLTSLATSDDNTRQYLKIESSCWTVNGLIKVTENFEFQPQAQPEGASNAADGTGSSSSSGGVMMVQTITSVHERTGNTNTTTRYFIPYHGTPPHQVM